MPEPLTANHENEMGFNDVKVVQEWLELLDINILYILILIIRGTENINSTLHMCPQTDFHTSSAAIYINIYV